VRIQLTAIAVAFLVVPLLAQESRPAAPSNAARLAEAARANDFTTFDTLYRAAPVPAYQTLHELWTYSVTDPAGAFYGADRYNQLVAAYPGLAAAIADHRIVDARGNVFYPSAETRAFLLAQADKGNAGARSSAGAASKRVPPPVAPKTTTPPPPRKAFKKA
jgi:hypothetical protein